MIEAAESAVYREDKLSIKRAKTAYKTHKRTDLDNEIAKLDALNNKFRR